MVKENIADKLRVILGIKSDIKDAIIEKGGVVNDSTPFGDYAQVIRDIEGGGGGGTPTLRLNWTLQPYEESWNGNTGFITGSCLTGCYTSSFTPPKLVYTMCDVPEEIKSAKLIICTGQVRYAWGDFWAITGGVNDNNGNVIECLANASSYFGGYNHYSGVDTYTGYQLCSSIQSPYAVGGTALNWQTIEFDGTTNHIKCYRQEGGATNTTNELYPLTNGVSPVEDIDAGQFTGVNGSFIGEGFKVVLNNDVADNSWNRGYNGNIDLLHTCLIINDEIVSYAMEIVGKADIGTFLINGNSNPLLNTATVYARRGYEHQYSTAIDLSNNDGAFMEAFAGEWFLLSFQTKNPVKIENVVEIGRPAYPRDDSISSLPFKLYGSNLPLNEDNFLSGTLVGTGEEAQYSSLYDKYGFKYHALVITPTSGGVHQQYSMKFLITVQEKVAEKAGEKFKLNAQFCGSQEGSYPLSNASDGDFETWWSHDNGSSAEPYIAFQIPELDITKEDKIRILASFNNAWGEYPTSLTVKAVTQEDIVMVQAGIYGLDSVGTTLAQIDRDLPCDKNLTKLTDYIEYRQVKDMLIVFKANSMNSGSFKVAEARIELEPKEE